MARLSFNLLVEGVDPETFVVLDYTGQESLSSRPLSGGGMCHGFHYAISLASRMESITAVEVVDKTAELQILSDGEIIQRVHGIVRSFDNGDIGHHHTFYHITLVPALERLSLRHNSRIFQTQTVPEIISVLLQEMGITDYGFSLRRESEAREFCVQYRETDLDFLHRLAAEEGIFYSFIHEEGKHTVLFSDDSELLPALGAPIECNAAAGGVADHAYISALTEHKSSAPSSSVLQDYSFKTPAYQFLQQHEGVEMEHQQHIYEHFDAPGRHKTDVAGIAFAQFRQEYLRKYSHVARGQSNHASLQAGVKFTLSAHLTETMNREWLVVEANHQGSQPQALEEAGGHGATTYSNQFTLIPSHKAWRANPQTKPQVDGPMIATVVGPEGEEIFCDEHGRVKLHFPWDRYSNGDEHSSCWVRVSQGWAGSQFGMMAIPRIGHEVIVSFLNGDPDQPIVTGRTYHASNIPPYVLPEHKTKTVIRSESHQGSGFNELSFEDQTENEKVYIHAQKDFESEVLNDHCDVIRHDKHTTIDNDHRSHIKNNQHSTIDGECISKIGLNKVEVVNGDSHQKAAGVTVIESGSEIHLNSGGTTVVEAGSEITLKVGGNFVKIDASGVHIVGAEVGLNSGGSAGSGTPFGEVEVELPNLLDAMAPPEESEYVAAEATLTVDYLPAVQDGALIVDSFDSSENENA